MSPQSVYVRVCVCSILRCFEYIFNDLVYLFGTTLLFFHSYLEYSFRFSGQSQNTQIYFFSIHFSVQSSKFKCKRFAYVIDEFANDPAAHMLTPITLTSQPSGAHWLLFIYMYIYYTIEFPKSYFPSESVH